LLMKFISDPLAVEELLQLFQGAVLAFLISGDPEPGRRAFTHFFSDHRTPKKSPASRQGGRARR